VKVLKSTAAPIEDTWSDPAHPVKTNGGGTQDFLPYALQNDGALVVEDVGTTPIFK
jgi:hypothetical protein